MSDACVGTLQGMSAHNSDFPWSWNMLRVMKRLRITSGGQVSVPAEVRRRWNTNTVLVEDRGDHVVLRPAPDDPVAAAYGAFAHLAKRPLREVMAEYDEEERRAEARPHRSRKP